MPVADPVRLLAPQVEDSHAVLEQVEVGALEGVDCDIHLVAEGEEFVGQVDQVPADAASQFRCRQCYEWSLHIDDGI
jgi:hypothetical protein